MAYPRLGGRAFQPGTGIPLISAVPLLHMGGASRPYARVHSVPHVAHLNCKVLRSSLTMKRSKWPTRPVAPFWHFAHFAGLWVPTEPP